MRSLSFLTLVLALTSAIPLGAQIRQCTVPTGLSGYFSREFGSVGTPESQIQAYEACVAERGREVMADPFSGVIEQHRLDNNTNFIFRVGRQVIGWLPYGDIVGAVEMTHSSDALTPEIRAGIRAKYDAFSAQYTATRQRRATGTVSVNEARQLLAGWTALKADLEASLPKITNEKTAALVRQRISSGDGLAWGILLDAVQSTAMTPGQVRQILAEANLGSDARVLEEIRSRVSELASQAEARDRAERSAAASAADIQRIGEYATFSHALLGVASYAGILSPRDAATMQGIVGGVSQIATAAAILDAGTYASAAGPYGMAIGGGLMIAGALQRPGQSEGQAVMAALRQLSEQVARLQRSVDRGFEGLSTQLSQTERRITTQLSYIIRQNDLTALRTAQLRADVQALREYIVAHAEEARLATNLAFVKRIPYEDERCLRKFRFWQGGERTKCLETYAGLTREFVTTANASLVGRPNRALTTQTSVYDQFAAVVAEGARLTGRSDLRDAVHGPTLALLDDRVRLFVTHNPGVRSQPLAETMFRELNALRTRHESALTVLQSDSVRVLAEQGYSAELQRILQTIDVRTAQFTETAIVTETDSIHIAEVQRRNQPTALAAQASLFPSAGPALAGRIGVPPTPLSVLGESTQGFGRHLLIAEKLRNYARAAETKDSVGFIVAPDLLEGFTWVAPCNPQSEYLAFPVRRRLLGDALGEDLVALTAAGRGLLSLCYTPEVAHRDGENVGIGNTRTDMHVVQSRLASEGMEWRNFCGYRIGDYGYKPPQGPAYIQSRYMALVEYTGSAWEGCHQGDHLHHVLTTRARQITGVTFEATLNLPGYRSATKRVATRQGYPAAHLDICLLPVNTGTQWHPASLFSPFRQQFPLSIQQGCGGIDQKFAAAVPELRRQLAVFLDSAGTTRLVGDPASPEITYRAAMQDVLRKRRDENYRAYLTAILGPDASYETLDRLHAFRTALVALRAPTTASDSAELSASMLPTHMSGADLRNYLATMLRDPVSGRLTTAQRVVRTTTVPSTTPSVSPVTAVVQQLQGALINASFELPRVRFR